MMNHKGSALDGETHRLPQALTSIVGPEHVLHDEDALARYAVSPNLFSSTRPSLAVRPASQDEIQAILHLATETRTPVLVRGGGLSTGGFLASPPNAILLDTTRLNRVLAIDGENYFVTAECGVTMGALRSAVEQKGLLVNTVSTPEADGVSLGGNLSGMLGGGDPARVSHYGVHARQLLALSVALPNGAILNTGAGGDNIHRRGELERAASGPDLAGLFIGDGGAFGVKLTATLRIFPAPPLSTESLWVLADFASFYAAFLGLTRADPLPFAVLHGAEEGERFTLRCMVEAHDRATLLTLQHLFATICSEAGGQEISTDGNGGQRTDPFEQGISITLYCGRTDVPHVRETVGGFIKTALREHALGERGIRTGVAYRPIQRTAVHITFRLDWSGRSLTWGPAERTTILEIVESGYRLAISLGCSPTGHHAFTARAAAAAWSSEYRATMTALKELFDPAGILNPGFWW
jgi:FAD/FMN-containing dehydrogenase